jgi:hypothetical protein
MERDPSSRSSQRASQKTRVAEAYVNESQVPAEEEKDNLATTVVRRSLCCRWISRSLSTFL